LLGDGFNRFVRVGCERGAGYPECKSAKASASKTCGIMVSSSLVGGCARQPTLIKARRQTSAAKTTGDVEKSFREVHVKIESSVGKRWAMPAPESDVDALLASFGPIPSVAAIARHSLCATIEPNRIFADREACSGSESRTPGIVREYICRSVFLTGVDGKHRTKAMNCASSAIRLKQM